MERKFFGSDVDIILKTHGLSVSQNTTDWDWSSNQHEGWSYNSMPCYNREDVPCACLVHKEFLSRDGEMEEEDYLVFDPERV